MFHFSDKRKLFNSWPCIEKKSFLKYLEVKIDQFFQQVST